MKHLLAVLFVATSVGILLGGGGTGDKPKAKSKDGTWAVESIVANGFKVPEEELKKVKVTISGEKYTVMRDGEVVEEGTTKVDTSKTPVHLEVNITSGKNKGMTLYGIAEGDENTMKAHVGKERPKDFTPREGTTLIIYRRLKS